MFYLILFREMNYVKNIDWENKETLWQRLFCLGRFAACRDGSFSDNIHIRQQMRPHSVAGDSRKTGSRNIGFRAQKGKHAHLRRATGLVGAFLGQNRLPVRRLGPWNMRHRRLRLRRGALQRKRRHAACHARRVHARVRVAGLLRREPCRRLQPPDDGGRQRRLRLVRHHRLRGGPEPTVPSGAEGGRRRRVPERLSRVRETRVLLQRRV